MKIEFLKNYELMSKRSAEIIQEELICNPSALMCTPGGNSPLGTYNELAKSYKKNSSVFSKLRIIKLDEWWEIDLSDKNSCESFIKDNLLIPLEISDSRYYGFEISRKTTVKECLNVKSGIEKEGPIDICILGIGINGHIGFNEPGGFLHPYSHVTNLSLESLLHPMATDLKRPPTFGITLGMAEIMQSKMVILLVTGHNKNNIIDKLLTTDITTELPASFLWLHPNTICLINEETISVSNFNRNNFAHN